MVDIRVATVIKNKMNQTFKNKWKKNFWNTIDKNICKTMALVFYKER